METLYYDKYALAARYGVSHHTITDWRTKRLLPYTKTGYRTIRFPVAFCDAALQRLTRQTPSELRQMREVRRSAQT